jgi:hypothetical protein
VRTIRLAALGTVLALLATLFSAGSATAASPGIGTSAVTTTIAQLDLGDLLSARILGDDSRSTIDKGVLAVPEAATVLRPLTIASGVPALSALNKEIAPVETRTQGAEKKTDYSTDLDTIGLPQLIDGTVLPVSLSAIVDDAGARGGLLSTLSDLNVASGLVSVDSIVANLGTNAAKDSSLSTRGLDVDSIGALNLGALLAGLGLPLDSLDVADLSALTDALGLLDGTTALTTLLGSAPLSLPVPTDAAGLAGAITGVDTTFLDAAADLASLQNTIATTLAGVCGGTALLVGVTGPLGLPAGTACNTALTTLTGDRNAAALDLKTLVGGLLNILDDTSLLTVSGLDVGLTSKATDAVGTSVAQVTAALGSLEVANLGVVDGLDLSATAAQITGLADTVTGQLDGVLGVLGLDGIVSLDLLDTTGTGVTKTPTGYVRSVSNLTGVDLNIDLSALDLEAVIGNLTGGTAISSLLGPLSGVPGLPALPALEGVASMELLNTLLGNAAPLGALADGARLRLAGVGGAAEFLPATAGAPATPTGGTLPRTGGTSGMTGFAVAAVVMAMLGLGVRRRVLAPVRVD